MITSTPNPFSSELVQLHGPLHALLEASPVATVVVDRGGHIRQANGEAGRLMDLSREEMAKLPVGALLPERLHGRLAAVLREFFGDPKARRFSEKADLYVRRRDGTERPVEIGLSPLRLGEDVFMIAVVADVTARELAEQEKVAFERRAQAQSRALMTIMNEPATAGGELGPAIRRLTEVAAPALEVGRAGVWLLDEDGRTLRCSDVFSGAKGGHFKESALSRSMFPSYFEAMETELTIAVQDARKDPRVADLLAGYIVPHGIGATLDAPIRMRGHVVGVFCLEHLGGAREWTVDERVFAGVLADQAALLLLQAGHVKAERVASNAAQRLREIFDNAMEAIFSLKVTPAGGFIFESYNPAAAHATGLTQQQVRGRRPDELFSPAVAVRLEGNYRRCFETGNAVEYIEEMDFGAAPRMFHTILAPVRDEEGKVFRIVGFARDVTAQKEAERKLAASERLLRTVQDSSFHFVAVLGIDGRLLRSNQTALAAVGARAEEVEGKLFWETPWWRHSPAEQARVRAAVERAGTGEQVRFETTQAGAGDGPRFFDFSIKPVRDDEGRVIALIPEGHDITERKRSEEALRRSEEKFSKAFRASPDAISLSDFETGRYTDINEGHVRLFGYSREEAVGRSPEELGIHVDAAEVAATRGLLVERGSYREVEVMARNRRGESITLLMSAELIEIGGQPRVLRVSRDVTERKQVERALRESEARFRSYFESPLVGMAITGPDRRWIEVNDHLCEMLGYRREELLRMQWSDLTPEGDLQATELLLARALRGEIDTYSLEKRYRRADGGIVHANIGVRAIRKAGGAVEHFLTVVQDITARIEAESERSKMEGQLRQAQKLEALGQLAGGIAHDFNNILTAIMAYSELAEMDAGNPPEVRRHLTQVQAASHRAKDLVRRILAFSRQREQERKPLHLKPVVQEALKLLRSTLPSTIEIDARIDAVVPVVLADGVQVHQVLMNLCTNAAHAMREQPGRLAVTLELETITAEGARLNADLVPGRYACLTVRDFGHGMSAEVLKRIFEPFFTTKAPGEGTGLGLAVVHGIMKDHEGAIRVDSRPGEGAVFRLYFPEYTAASVENVETGRGELQRGRGESLLFVDDERSLCDSAQKLLERLGYRVTSFVDPMEALRRFRADPAAFDLVLTDLTMPRMTGVDLAKEIAALRPNLPVLLSSGFSGMWTVERVRALGIRDLVSKPLTAIALSEAVRRALDEPRPQPTDGRA